MRKDSIIAAVLTFCLTSIIFLTATSRSAEYDPWVDLNDDGRIDIYDVVGMTSRYGATGDSTKNVSVTNWPRSTDVHVWFGYSIPDGGTAVSPTQYAEGVSTLHILIRAGNLGGSETIRFLVYGHLLEADHGSYYGINAYTVTLNSTDNYVAVSIDVPSEMFHFGFIAASGTACTVYMSYYMT